MVWALVWCGQLHGVGTCIVWALSDINVAFIQRRGDAEMGIWGEIGRDMG
jgi:hypothetical protein